jgi:phosphatidylglycerophosphate synthase
MLDRYFRALKDALLLPFARQLAAVHPTVISFVGLAVGLVAAALLTQQQYLWGMAAWLFNRFLDGLDGTIARTTHQQSDLGGYLDILFDFVVYAVLPLALAVGMPSQINFLAAAFLLATFYVNSASWMYLAGILEKRKHGAGETGELTTITMPGGLIGGTETIIFFSLFILLPTQMALLFTVMAILVIITVVQRIIWAMRYLD